MSNDNVVLKNIQEHFNKAHSALDKLNQNENNLGLAYRTLAQIIRETEFIIYMANKSYVKRETEKKWRIIQDWASNMNPTPGPTSFRRTSWLSVLSEELS